jgi:hypothetical protein
MPSGCRQVEHRPDCVKLKTMLDFDCRITFEGGSTMRLVICPALAFLAIASPAIAKEPCPPRETGTYPWAVKGLMNGDLWGWVYLELDKDRRVQRCLMGENNIHDDQLRFFACRAFTQDWEPAKATDVAPGSTVKRLFVMAGEDHLKANRAARKRFFQEHPEERSECYPEY